MIKVKLKVDVDLRAVSKQEKAEQQLAKPVQRRGKIPRVSRLMAISIQFDRMLRSGEAKDTLHLAEMHSISSPRVTQIMNLALLAPDIQEALLNLPREFVGRSAINEKMMRPIAAEVDWDKQRSIWKALHNEAERCGDSRS
jgi:hypothetical protein